MFRILTLFLAGIFFVPAFAWTTLTIKSGQTIDGIAAKYRPAGVAEMDMVIALRSANPGLNGKGLQVGSTLRVPTTSVDVREALTGKAAPKVAIVPPVKATKSANKTSVAVPAKPVTQSAPVKKASNSVAVKTVKSAPVVAKTPKPVPISPPIATKTLASAPVVAPAAALASSTMKTPAAYQITIDNLQQALNNQTQTLQAYQAQISTLTQELNASATKGTLPNSGISHYVSLQNIWFIFWVITLFFWWRAYRQQKMGGEIIQSLQTEPSIKAQVAADEPDKTTITPLVEKTQQDRVEPSIHAASTDESWRQVELDIPEMSPASPTPLRFEPTLSAEAQHELVGEQAHIINAIAQDHDNVSWHLALLEFYGKTDNESGFVRHMQTMIRTGLMSEGDTLWEKIRKMYLNDWIYKEEI